MKRTLILLLVIVLLLVGWFVGWHVVADRIDQEVNNASNRAVANGGEIICVNRQVTGFPFRISLNCDEFGVQRPRVGMLAGKLRTAAQVYQPGKVVGELNGPATVRLPDGRVMDVNWLSMRGSASLNLSGPDRFSLVARELIVEPRDAVSDRALAERAQFHGRKANENDLELAVEGEKVVSPQRRWPQFDIKAAFRFDDIYDSVLARPDLVRIGRQQGLKGQIFEFDYVLKDGGSVSVEGPFEIDQSGILSGRFNVTSRENSKLLAVLKELLPEQRGMLDQALPVVLLLENQSDDAALKVTMNINKGRVSLGLIPIGNIAPLY